MDITFHWMHRNNWENSQEGLLEMAQQLEIAGITSVLLPYSPEGIDFSLHLPLILRRTKKIRMMLAIAAYSTSPEYLSKTYQTLGFSARGRVDLNLVAGKYEQDKFDMMMKYYPGDKSLVDEHDKRVELTEPWMEKFFELSKEKDFVTKLCVVGSSDTTIRIADKFADYIIIADYQTTDEYLSRLTNTKPILVIDPLVLDEGQSEQDVKYIQYKFTKQPDHSIKGTHDQVVAQIREKARQTGVNNFMILTDQVDLTKLYKVVQELTSKPV